MIAKIKSDSELLEQYFWRGLYRISIDFGITIHKINLYLYKKVDYKYFVKNIPESQLNSALIGVTRQPFRNPRRAWST